MPLLSPDDVRKVLAGLRLTDSVRDHTQRLLDLLGPDQRVQVQQIHEILFPLIEPASANTAVNRLLRAINDATADAGLTVRAEITKDKKAGAANRWVWFEGPESLPDPAPRPELEAIDRRPDGMIADTRGEPAGDLPCVLLLSATAADGAALVRAFCPDDTPPVETRGGVRCQVLGTPGGMRVLHPLDPSTADQRSDLFAAAIAAWRPRALIGIGTASGADPAGPPDGAVLVATAVRGYRLGQGAGRLVPTGKDLPAGALLIRRFQALADAAPAGCPALHLGPLLSGPPLAARVDYSAGLHTPPGTLGVEDAGLGLALAAAAGPLDWVLVAGSTGAVDGRDPSTEPAAARTPALAAAQAVRLALTLGPLFAEPAPPAGICPRLADLRDIQILIPKAPARPASLVKDAPTPVADTSVDALAWLLDWVGDPAAPPLFALLGEYGMGKTVTCQRLAERLDAEHRADPTRPLPLYLDLRHLTGLAARVPRLPEIVEECMARGWDPRPDARAYGFAEFQTWLTRPALVIFDGLDEALVKLSEADGQVFTNELLRLVPRPGTRPCWPRVLISCRTHYFRTLRDQQTHFTGQERGPHDAAAYRALVLLPLTEDQVRRYLAAALAERTGPPPAEGANPALERLLETIAAVHNLTELTRRPYTLRLVAEFIPELEQDRLAGRPVYGVTLYRRMAARWLDRDQYKHWLRREDKLTLAMHLAARLWREGSGRLPVLDLERWLLRWIDSDPDLRLRYRDLKPDQLEEDLRTATFLVRDDDAGGGFRFAHTSLLEYFLAEYLLAAVRDQAPERWDLPLPSLETLDFLGQLLAEAGNARQALLGTLHGWCAPYRPRVSELLLAYSLRARRQGWPTPVLRGLALTGVDLSDWDFRPRDSLPDQPTGHWLDLSGADLTGAVLRRTVFEGVRLVGARFRDTVLTQASFLDCDATASDWSGAECDGAVWRLTALTGSTWIGARGHRPQFIRCEGASADIPGMTSPRFAPLTLAVSTTDASGGPRPPLRALSGLQGFVNACAFSADGSRVLTVGEDGTLCLWGTASGTPLLTLSGHWDLVLACAFAQDGSRLLSAGKDGMLRLWDTASGAELLALSGHEGSATACAFAPDGSRLLAAGKDGMLRLWDAASGAPLLTLSGHLGTVNACTFAPDGSRLLSAGFDGTLRLWDSASGARLLTLFRHRGEVLACAFSPDGSRLLSAGHDGTLCLWDAVSGALLLTLFGHLGQITACTFAPDGSRLLSAGRDGTLRLWDAASGASLLVLCDDPDAVSARAEIKDYVIAPEDPFGHYPNSVIACAFAPDGSHLLCASKNGTLCLWNAASGALLLTLSLSPYKSPVNACAFAPDGARLLFVADDGCLRLWDTASGAPLRTLSGHEGRNCALALDSSRLFSAPRANWSGGTLRFWDAESGTPLLTLSVDRSTVNACTFSPDGSRVLCAEAGDDVFVYGHLRLCDAASGAPLLTLSDDHQGAVNACAFAPDGSRLLSGGDDGTLRLWDAASGAQLLTVSGHRGGVLACAFSPDGSRMLSAGNDGTLWLWEATSGAPLFPLSGHRGGVLACAFSPDGSCLLSAGSDGTLRLWEAASGAPMLILAGHRGRVLACAFSPDGSRLLSAGNDGTLRLWDAATGQLLRVHAIETAPHPGWAVWEPPTNRVIAAGGEAWRWLAWVATDADGWPDPLPLETFGPIPGL